MMSQSSCTICILPYNKTTRKEMMLCLNQHYLCLNCAQKISKKNSLCPFCKVPFDLKMIRPRRHDEDSLPVKTDCKKGDECAFCPSGHNFGKFTVHTTTCRMCKEDSKQQWSCYTCGYIICKTCIESRKGSKREPEKNIKPKNEVKNQQQGGRKTKKIDQSRPNIDHSERRQTYQPLFMIIPMPKRRQAQETQRIKISTPLFILAFALAWLLLSLKLNP